MVMNQGKDVMAGVLETGADLADDAVELGAAVVDSTAEAATDVVKHSTAAAKGFISIPASFARNIAKALRGDGAKPLNSPRWWLRKILGGAAGGLAGMIAVTGGHVGRSRRHRGHERVFHWALLMV